ncbi:MAG: hypothetical protein JXB24_12455 [Bacteroidales bacterium]|nr:hypothetical protein [Bacteroidales bacterium]
MVFHSIQGAKTPLEVIATGTAGWFCRTFSISSMKFMEGLYPVVFTAGIKSLFIPVTGNIHTTYVIEIQIQYYLRIKLSNNF